MRTDEVLPQFIGEHGGYTDMFTDLLQESAQNRMPPVSICLESFDVRLGDLPPPAAFDGYVITGSRSSVYDDDAWIADLASFLKAALSAGARVVGICFGHQLIAHFFGGETVPSARGWTVGVQENTLIAPEPWMSEPHRPDRRLNLIASHKDQVARLPAGARLMVTSDACPIGGFVIGDQILTLQGHPEFEHEYSRALMTMRRELLGEETFQAGIRSLQKETDDMRAGCWIIDFLVAPKCSA